MIKEISCNKKQLKIQIRSDADESVFGEIFLDKDYRILDETIKVAKNVVVDIGAHIGLFSIYANTINPNIPIYAYEPEEENYKTLKKNLSRNKTRNIHPKNLAVSAKEGQIELYINKDSHNHSILKTNENQTKKKVQSTTLQRITEKLQTVDLVKMDCEGAEFEIIASTPKETFKKIKTIYIEYHEYNEMLERKNIESKLQKAGYKVTWTPSFYDDRMGFILAKT